MNYVIIGILVILFLSSIKQINEYEEVSNLDLVNLIKL